MKTQQEIDKTAKRFYIDDGDRKIPIYLFIAKAEKVVEDWILDQRVIEHQYTDLFCFYECNINRATQEFLRRLSNCEIENTLTEVELKYMFSDGGIITTGIKVEL